MKQKQRKTPKESEKLKNERKQQVGDKVAIDSQIKANTDIAEQKQKLLTKTNKEQIPKERLTIENLAKRSDSSKRPLVCFIPFAHIRSKKCRELAATNPLYDCKALTDCMME